MNTRGRFALAKKAIKAVLGTLRPFDRIGDAAFSDSLYSNTKTGLDCLDKKLSFATEKNKYDLIKWVDKVKVGGGSVYSYGIEIAIKMFKETRYDDSVRKRAVNMVKEHIIGHFFVGPPRK